MSKTLFITKRQTFLRVTKEPSFTDTLSIINHAATMTRETVAFLENLIVPFKFELTGGFLPSPPLFESESESSNEPTLRKIHCPLLFHSTSKIWEGYGEEDPYSLIKTVQLEIIQKVYLHNWN